jgi:hypothetical protein
MNSKKSGLPQARAGNILGGNNEQAQEIKLFSNGGN